MKVSPSFFEHREFAEIDRHFSKWIAGFGGPEFVRVIAALLSRNLRLGHICLDLETGPSQADGLFSAAEWPGAPTCIKALEKNRAIGRENDGTPLVLDRGGRLYMRRYWDYERQLAAAILKRCDVGKSFADHDDMQQTAVEAAVRRKFLVISGGPGTGKTTTVIKILERLALESGGAPLRVALAAPTGKAAARMEESLRNGGVRSLDALPKTASTLHRLLGADPTSVRFLHHAGNPLPVDLVVVDEASMVPLTLMAKLFDAVPENSRIILLGDQHQLASVEPGYVLGDIAHAAGIPGAPLEGCLVELRKNYRFGNQSSIFALSSAVRDGNTDRVFEILRGPSHPDLTAAELPPRSQFSEHLRTRVIEGYSPYLQAREPAEALRKFQQFRILCAYRAGIHGVENLNALAVDILTTAGLLRGVSGEEGLPVLITSNDHEQRLYNGDIGLLFPDESGVLKAWFPAEEGGVRQIPISRLPSHEHAFAMTVHKSQGSEYERTLLILPDRESPVFTRELVYTGITRARERVELWYREPALRGALMHPTTRGSGLRDRLSKK